MQLVLLSFLLLTPLLSSSVRENPLFDRYYTSISIKQENERLDNYAIQLKNGPGSRALIVVYSENEQSTPAAKARARRAVRYLVKTHGLDPARVVMRFEGACSRHNQILLYLYYPNEADRPPDPECLEAAE